MIARGCNKWDRASFVVCLLSLRSLSWLHSTCTGALRLQRQDRNIWLDCPIRVFNDSHVNSMIQRFISTEFNYCVISTSWANSSNDLKSNEWVQYSPPASRCIELWFDVRMSSCVNMCFNYQEESRWFGWIFAVYQLSRRITMIWLDICNVSIIKKNHDDLH